MLTSQDCQPKHPASPWNDLLLDKSSVALYTSWKKVIWYPFINSFVVIHIGKKIITIHVGLIIYQLVESRNSKEDQHFNLGKLPPHIKRQALKEIHFHHLSILFFYLPEIGLQFCHNSISLLICQASTHSTEGQKSAKYLTMYRTMRKICWQVSLCSYKNEINPTT